jgi:hypothetical protein
MSDSSIQATPPGPEPVPLRAVGPAQPVRSFVSVLPFTVTVLALHAILCWGLAALLLFYVPRVIAVFHNYNMRLSPSAEMLVSGGRWLANYWYVTPPFFFLWLLGAGCLLAVLRQRRRRLAWLWALLLLLAPLLLGVYGYFEIHVPYVDLLSIAPCADRPLARMQLRRAPARLAAANPLR